jgi:serpin B
METKSNKLWLIALAAVTMMTVACCSDKEELTNEPISNEGSSEPTVLEPKTRVDIVISPEESKVNDAVNQFSLKFFNQMVNAPMAVPNVFVSPFSAQAALSMTANGAKGETLKQMLAALNMQDFDLNAINKYNQSIIKAIATLDNTSFLSSANGIWSRVDLLESFIGSMQESYDAKAEKTDFSREALIAINDWAKEHTKGMIPELYDVDKGVSPSMIVVLANALYFNGAWKDPFDKAFTEKGVFTNSDKSQSVIDMMKESGYRNYLDCGTFDLCEKPYGNEAFSMVFLLPHKGTALSQCIGELTMKDWKALTASLEESEKLVRLTVPKFEWKNLEYNLKPALESMGMQIPFTDQADFRNMTEWNGLFIGSVTQKTALSLNEQGTQAAAITKIEMWGSNGDDNYVDFVLNRPFAFLIKEKSTGVILFAGAVNRL